jgi:hypothetical protein
VRWACAVLEFLAEPRHGAIKVMQREVRTAGKDVILHPLLAGAIGARHEQAMQHTHEHRPFERELEGAFLEMLLEHRLEAEVLPQAPEQQRTAEAAGTQAGGAVLIRQRRQRQDLVAVAGAGGQQGGQAAAGGEFVEAAEGGDDVLANGAVLAAVLDDLQVTARPGLLEAEEHGAPPAQHHDTPRDIRRKAEK